MVELNIYFINLTIFALCFIGFIIVSFIKLCIVSNYYRILNDSF